MKDQDTNQFNAKDFERASAIFKETLLTFHKSILDCNITLMKYSDKYGLKDLLGFHAFAIANNLDWEGCLLHDVGSFISKDKCFFPRSSGYKKFLH